MSDLLSLWPFVLAGAGFLGVWQLARRAPSTRLAWAFTVTLWLAWGTSIFFVDTNIPLSESHFRPGGEPVPPWFALIVVMIGGAKFGALMGTVTREKAAVDRAQGGSEPAGRG